MSEQDTITEPAKEAPTKQVANRGKRRVLLVGVPTVIVVASVLFYMLGGRYAETDNAYVQADITSITNQVSGPISEVKVKENERVTKGQLLYVIDPQLFKLAEDKALGQLSLVRSNLLAQKANYREQEAQLKLAETKLAFYQREEKRQKGLIAQHFASTANYDQAQENTRESEINVLSLKEKLNALRAVLDGDPNMAVEDHASYKTLLSIVNKARLDLAHTQIRAPSNGIASKLPKLGEYTTTGMITMVLVANQDTRIEANFTEKDLTNVEPGQSVEIEIDTYPDHTWKGKVESISPATGSQFSVIPAENATGNWVKIAQRLTVRISIDQQPDEPILRAGMSAQVAIDTKHHRSLFGITL